MKILSPIKTPFITEYDNLIDSIVYYWEDYWDWVAKVAQKYQPSNDETFRRLMDACTYLGMEVDILAPKWQKHYLGMGDPFGRYVWLHPKLLDGSHELRNNVLVHEMTHTLNGHSRTNRSMNADIELVAESVAHLVMDTTGEAIPSYSASYIATKFKGVSNIRRLAKAKQDEIFRTASTITEVLL